MTIKNLSEIKNTYQAELSIRCKNNKNLSVNNYSIVYNPNDVNIDELTLFERETKLDEKGMKTAWIAFKKPAEFLTDKFIEKYTVKFTDVHGKITEFSTHILKQYINENRAI